MTEEQTREGRVIDLSVEVPGTVEEVWAAISTGPGIGSWFVRHEVEERVGGSATMDFGDWGTDTATVTAFEPPHRIELTSHGDRPLAYEWSVEARDGGTCVVRLVNSGFGPGADWDGDYDAMTLGWRTFLANLRVHRTYFPGRTAVPVVPNGWTDGPHDAAWQTFCRVTGVDPALRPGDAFSTGGAGADPAVPLERGRVEEVLTEPGSLTAYVVLLDEPVPGTAIVIAEGAGDRVLVGFQRYSYPDAASAAVPTGWEPFFGARFPLDAPV
jgi:uncharacterized protein YndB with AHSA1/START domain